MDIGYSSMYKLKKTMYNDCIFVFNQPIISI